MNSETRNQAHEAARLLAFAMTPKASPAREPEYRILLERYDTETEFMEMAQVIASGLGVSIAGRFQAHGLVIVNQKGGPFTPTLSDFKSYTSAVDHVVDGLLLLMLGAWIYPTPARLDEEGDTVIRINVRQATKDIHQSVKQMVDKFGPPESDDPKIREALSELAKAPQVGNRRSSVSGRLRNILEKFEQHGYVQQVGGSNGSNGSKDADDAQYIARPALRIQVRYMMRAAASDLLERCKSALDEIRKPNA